jgi:hypothetical protein
MKANALSSPKVVPMSTINRPHKPGPMRITQEDLAEEELLRQAAAGATKALKRKRLEIRSAIEAGADVEPGIRFARLTSRKVLTIH